VTHPFAFMQFILRQIFLIFLRREFDVLFDGIRFHLLAVYVAVKLLTVCRFAFVTDYVPAC